MKKISFDIKDETHESIQRILARKGGGKVAQFIRSAIEEKVERELTTFPAVVVFPTTGFENILIDRNIFDIELNDPHENMDKLGDFGMVSEGFFSAKNLDDVQDPELRELLEQSGNRVPFMTDENLYIPTT